MARPTTTNLGLKKSFTSDPENQCGLAEHWGPIMDANLDAIDAALTLAATAASPVFTGNQTFNGANGEQVVYGQSTELITLSTSGLTSDSTANLLPAGAIIDAVVARVTTTITTATNWAVGDTTTAARFSSANTAKTAGTTSVGLNHMSGASTTLGTGPSQVAAAKVRITCTGSNPGDGIIRITVFYRQFVAPTS